MKELLLLGKHESVSVEKDVDETEIIEGFEDISDENDLYIEDLAYAEDYGESSEVYQDKFVEFTEIDLISKIELILSKKKAQTKYAALNINSKLTIEQRRVLERGFDLISQEYEPGIAEKSVNTIAEKYTILIKNSGFAL